MAEGIPKLALTLHTTRSTADLVTNTNGTLFQEPKTQIYGVWGPFPRGGDPLAVYSSDHTLHISRLFFFFPDLGRYYLPKEAIITRRTLPVVLAKACRVRKGLIPRGALWLY